MEIWVIPLKNTSLYYKLFLYNNQIYEKIFNDTIIEWNTRVVLNNKIDYFQLG